jgi:hypothetical protein
LGATATTDAIVRCRAAGAQGPAPAAVPDLLACLATVTWVLLALLVLSGCAATGAPYRQFEIRPGGEAEPRLSKDPREDELLAAITWVMGHKLDLPLPAGVTAYVYVNQATFVEGMMLVTGTRSEAAWEQGHYAAAVATGREIFLRGDRLASMSLSGRAGLLAHELAHVSQRSLASGGRSNAAVWIREGHADWVKARVLDALGYVPYAESHAEVVRTIRRSSMPVRFFPDLASIARNSDFIDARNRLGNPATYGQSFLAVDWLVERYGHARLVDFLRTFASDVSGARWGAVYPISYREFIDEFRARLEALP